MPNVNAATYLPLTDVEDLSVPSQSLLRIQTETSPQLHRIVKPAIAAQILFSQPEPHHDLARATQ
jgi:hypothetical protein